MNNVIFTKHSAESHHVTYSVYIALALAILLHKSTIILAKYKFVC